MDRIIAVLGPTASGKSDLGVSIAKFIRRRWPDIVPVIISADSRQVYRGLDIGSGKITKKEMGGIPHFMLDVASPKRRYSVARYQRDTKKLFSALRRQHKNLFLIIVGGSGQYVDAILSGAAFPAVPPNPKLRAKLERLSTKELFERLRAVDANRACAIDPHNRRRIVRALEIYSATQSPIPPLKKSEPLDALKIGIQLSQTVLRARIHLRLVSRMRIGMMREVERLHERGVSWRRLDELGLEYRYVSRYLRGMLTKDKMMMLLEAEIAKYARRQMTWFRRDADIRWIRRIPRQKDWNDIIARFLCSFRT